jgi:putative phosphoribosyl transferase
MIAAISAPAHDLAVAIPHDETPLDARLDLPSRPMGLIFALRSRAHDAPRRGEADPRLVRTLAQQRIGTLALDLLDEEVDTAPRIRELVPPFRWAVDWAETALASARLPFGIHATGQSAAIALHAAVDDPRIRAIVVRSGRVDLANAVVDRCTTPTLLIVGGNDPALHGLSRAAFARLRGPKKLAIVPGASHLFTEPGALTAAMRLTLDWYGDHLKLRAGRDAPQRWW